MWTSEYGIVSHKTGKDAKKSQSLSRGPHHQKSGIILMKQHEESVRLAKLPEQ